MTDQEAVLAAIDHRPQTIAELAATTYLPRRTVEKAIEDARRRVGICTDPAKGVWYPNDPEELAASNRALRRRLQSQYRTLRAQQNAERRMRAPRVLFPELG